MDGPSSVSDVEMVVQDLLQTLLELGICAADVDPAAVEGTGEPPWKDMSGGLIGSKINELTESLAQLSASAGTSDLSHRLIPLAIIKALDANKNPDLLTKAHIDRAASENQYAKGQLDSLAAYRDLLAERMADDFPALKPGLAPQALSSRKPNGRSGTLELPRKS
ncbi:uncharacterized protein L969DRAFT_96042 [Mixia osmundae IAM 14324]|uniref:Mediator of RNA polymerase II transcription subunit 10 n=1 Tax=Mixia osmundae (strain CBS 9802 / IAM 14324 / JCM 22182 / KY 12970) TaxID=764103 RepID=G7DS74_MIXOS|nr:uncharacterized protein L969DRAFT_96042 [Mixia osmundae IAM 14324]KEI37513.1 hypothetical protein L969DRAFT_96042 [Mixia osmundae IAM 14324]GAA93434.1 hypothetical protein E5Q_00075 [Mixia osmundae IAM 14324]